MDGTVGDTGSELVERQMSCADTFAGALITTLCAGVWSDVGSPAISRGAASLLVMQLRIRDPVPGSCGESPREERGRALYGYHYPSQYQMLARCLVHVGNMNNTLGRRWTNMNKTSGQRLMLTDQTHTVSTQSSVDIETTLVLCFVCGSAT